MSKVAVKKLRQLGYRLIDIFRHIVSLDMRRTGNKEQFLALRTARLAVTLFSHVERVSDASGNHQ